MRVGVGLAVRVRVGVAVRVAVKVRVRVELGVGVGMKSTSVINKLKMARCCEEIHNMIRLGGQVSLKEEERTQRAPEESVPISNGLSHFKTRQYSAEEETLNGLVMFKQFQPT